MSTPPFGARVLGNDWQRLDGIHPAPARTVSVVVVHHDQERQLTRTLTALARQRYPRDRVEVIVVDDGSRRAPDVPEGVRLLRQERDGARRAAARNRGARAGRGEILCFLDADTAPEPEYLERLARLPSLTPEAVVVGRRRHARLDAVDPAAEIATAGPAHELPAPTWLHDGYVATRDLREAGPRGFRYVISAVLGCTRWFFDELGGFDEEFVEYGGEDWEWAHRAWLSGALFAHVPDAVAWHDGPDWGAREMTDRRAQKNAEAMRLAQLITSDGHRPRGLFGRRAPVVVELAPELRGPVAFICVDSLLEALPRAVVRVPDRLGSLFAGDPRVVPVDGRDQERVRWPQLHLVVNAPVRVFGPGLAALCDAMTQGDADAETGVCQRRRPRWSADHDRDRPPPRPGRSLGPRRRPGERERAPRLGAAAGADTRCRGLPRRLGRMSAAPEPASILARVWAETLAAARRPPLGDNVDPERFPDGMPRAHGRAVDRAPRAPGRARRRLAVAATIGSTPAPGNCCSSGLCSTFWPRPRPDRAVTRSSSASCCGPRMSTLSPPAT